jgi:hypothetical protein
MHAQGPGVRAPRFIGCLGGDMANMPAARRISLVPGRVAGGAGTGGWISWRRLQAVLRQSGDLLPDEVLLEVAADERGLVFILELSETPDPPLII